MKDDELIIDNFAGGGGATEGITRALGRPADIAINHDPDAIAMHKANHPHTLHLTEDVWSVDPRRVTDGRQVGFGWFSPDCKHFSRAKGGKPVDRKIRGLASVAVRWGKATDMRMFVLENVPEFEEWGPLSIDGFPIEARKGQSFRRWWGQLSDLGYQIEMRVIKACDYGAPTTRSRLYIVGRKDGLPIVWPDRTHGRSLTPYRIAADCIDWSLPCPSIFLDHDEGRSLGVKRPLKDPTLRRLARGVMRYVVNSQQPFIVPLTHQGERRAHGIDECFPTVTGAHRGELALASPTLARMPDRSDQVAAFLARHYGGHENDGSALFDPMFTITAKDHHALVTAHIQRDFGASIDHRADEPLGSITASGSGKAALVASSIVKLKGTCRDGHPMTEPLHTIQAGGGHYGQVCAFLAKYYGTDQDPRLDLPLSVITTKDRFALAMVIVRGERYAIVDIGMRMLAPRELFRAQGFRDSYVIDPMVPDRRSKKITRLAPLSKTAQVRMCGNSVCPDVAEALVRANIEERFGNVRTETIARGQQRSLFE